MADPAEASAAASAWQAQPGGALRGRLRPPGDKSISHRALILAALADGDSRIEGFLESADTLATEAALRAMGVRSEPAGPGRRLVQGVGIAGLQPPVAVLDCGNAGTGMRLLAGVLAGQGIEATLSGDASLSRRPMQRVIEPLRRMGARIESRPGGLPPLRLYAGAGLQAIDYTLPVPSAQVKSAVLLAALRARGTSIVREPQPTRDYTERMLAAFGWPVQFSPGCVSLAGGHRLQAREVVVPGDFSSAAFFLVAATLVPGSDLCLEAVGMNPRRTGLLQALQRMGADITLHDRRILGSEPVADLRVRHARLHGLVVPEALVPDMIDELPILFVAAALAEGASLIRGAAELRVKESDRIAVMAAGLRAMGVQVAEQPDGLLIQGRPQLEGACIQSCDDHRIAMSFAVAGQCARAPVRIEGCSTVATSFPGFAAQARACGMGLHQIPSVPRQAPCPG